MNTDASLAPASDLPGCLTEADQQGPLVEADLEGGGHRAEPRRIGRNIAGFDGNALGGVHAGQSGGLLNRTADCLAALLDRGAEDPAPGVAADRGGGAGT